RSLLVCTTNGNMEAAVTSGVGSTGGTYSYERNGIDIANGLTGTVNFELRAWRTYGAGECDVVYNRVVDHTWAVTITYQVLGTKGFNQNAFSVYPNPTNDIVNVSGNIVMKEVHLFNLLGQEVMANTAVNDKQLQLHTAVLPTGKYILKVLSDDGVQTLSVLKN
ncbi:MAG TPA: T9SS type A sorting domain-containing protein, partial [Flavobacterium sp.]|nr:T9SS type A sorting domain-containing protein [Flavobacterium sp.]